MKRNIVLFLICLFLAIPLFHRIDLEQQEKNRQRLEESLSLTALACYASEGFYPPTIAYLQEHYGLQYDQNQYGVFYEIFAENLMPTITVVILS